ncbi:MAG: diversity-generating retroelement protein Avd [Anaerolineales bacterium]
MNESPLFTRTYDFLMWLVPQVQKFPRVYRFTLAEHIQILAMAFQDNLISAGKRAGQARLDALKVADVQLEQLRHWTRYARDNHLFTIGQYEHAARMMAEVGRLLGAWIKQLSG